MRLKLEGGDGGSGEAESERITMYIIMREANVVGGWGGVEGDGRGVGVGVAGGSVKREGN